MKILRSFISQVLAEDFENYKNKASDIRFFHNMHDNLFDTNKSVKNKARKLKAFWNENADHNFFKNEVIKIHWFAEIFDFQDRLKTMMLKSSRKDEISAVPYLEGENLESDWGAIGVVLDGRVTFAANDMNTVYSGHYAKLSDENKKKYSSSGIPKRPTINSLNSIKYVMLNKETYKISDTLPEVILDNWRIKSMFFSDDFFEDADYFFEYNTYSDHIEIIKTIFELKIPFYYENDRMTAEAFLEKVNKKKAKRNA